SVPLSTPRLILEPAARNTAPAIALAALAAGPGALLLVLPSDHLIRDSAAFVEAVRRGLPAARDGWLVTFGMAPDRPETGYGYVERGAEIAPGVLRAARFVEKPDAATAQTYVDSGRYDWNAGIFLFQSGTFLDALARHAPDMRAAAEAAMAAATREGARIRPDAARFRASPAQSIDYAVMEKEARIALVPAAIGWSDVGSFDALWELADKDPLGTAAQGDVLAIDAENCLLRSDGPLVAAVGVRDIVVIAAPDAVLVVPRGDSQRVREAVEALKASGRNLP
ncbi:MAG: mannose-1-phosphate guanylyltransferase, partial [Allosphingosinicella sp.]|uniref:mannose-1-phosphate guanylyltransferase n=1 Tax=Allosphingosinicella sp. TaxID=2823234 RepID=UPI00393989E9